MIALQADPALDPAVAALRDELMKTLPTIAGAKAQMEGIVGKAIGPETLLIALFIVFCGRGVMAIAAKAFDEFQLTRAHRRECEREERAAAALLAARTPLRPIPSLAAPTTTQTPARAVLPSRPTQSEAN